MSSPDSLTLRVAGLGHKLTFKIPPGSTVGDLKREIETRTSLPAVYQSLLARGHRLESDGATLSEVHLVDRTRIMLLHNELYASEKRGYEELSALAAEIDGLGARAALAPASYPREVLDELVTRMCCRLDGVDMGGSANLRAMRKELIRRAEGVEGG